MAFSDLLKLLFLLPLLSNSNAQGNPPACLGTCNRAFWSSMYGSRCLPGEISCACRMQYHLILPCCLQEACTDAEISVLKGMNSVRDACMDDSGNSPEIDVGKCDSRYKGALDPYEKT